MKKNRILFFLLLNLFCKNQQPSESEIFKQVFADEKNKNAKIIFSKIENFDTEIGEEFFFIVRNGNEEIICIFKKKNSEFELVYKKNFALIEIGAYKYNSILKVWEPSDDIEEKIHLLKNIKFHKFQADEFNSFSFEYLSEEPPLKLFSIPMIVRNSQTVFDGMGTYKDSKILKSNNRLEYKILPEANQIQIEKTGVRVK